MKIRDLYEGDTTRIPVGELRQRTCELAIGETVALKMGELVDVEITYGVRGDVQIHHAAGPRVFVVERSPFQWEVTDDEGNTAAIFMSRTDRLAVSLQGDQVEGTNPHPNQTEDSFRWTDRLAH